MGIAPRRVSGPDGREWLVRAYRFRRPPWRHVNSGLSDDFWTWPDILLLPLVLVAELLDIVVLPILIFLAEASFVALASPLSSRRWVEAVETGDRPTRMSWQTDVVHAEAVVEQVARQLELGYDRIEPHNAAFLGFEDA